jgi:hypothetical protein
MPGHEPQLAQAPPPDWQAEAEKAPELQLENRVGHRQPPEVQDHRCMAEQQPQDAGRKTVERLADDPAQTEGSGRRLPVKVQ